MDISNYNICSNCGSQYPLKLKKDGNPRLNQGEFCRACKVAGRERRLELSKRGPRQGYPKCPLCGDDNRRGSGAKYCSSSCSSVAARRTEKARRSVFRIFKRDEGRCYLCEEPLLSEKESQVDHLIPRNPPEGFLPGGDHEVNLSVVHPRCNGKKGNLILEEALLKLKDNFLSEYYPQSVWDRYESYLANIPDGTQS